MMESTNSCTNLSGSKLNFFTAHGTIACRKSAPGMSSCFASQASRRPAISRRARHPAHAGWQVKHPLALSNCELPEEEERFTRLSGDPVWVATTGIPVRQGRFQRRFRCHFLDEILDLERSEFLELFQSRII